ncbi:YihY/virulence factor BrkB family protein [Candidatus Cyanaurora vandensis]|uniref:YihY/virulence factor BrkB family protein n=1 Tax=Candidatus Cyanaurora vandensis TaxID=2714958 RepID=UPI0025794BC3|nr:YihY/virulence factor BrkB family protein [Candidatus Cyanaurora vandensis]
MESLVIAFRRAVDDRLPNLAAEMAFNLMLALLPTMLVLVTAIGLFGGSAGETFEWLITNLGRFVPQEVMEILRAPLRQVAYSEEGNLFSLSLLGSIFAASGAVVTAMESLDITHEVPPNERRPFWLLRLVAVALLFGTVLLVVAACLTLFLGSAVLTWVSNRLPESTLLLTLWEGLQWPLALLLIIGACALLYRFGPTRRDPATPLWPGALLASVLWLGVSAVFKFYIQNFSDYNQTYGSIGAAIILLLWLQLSAAALLFGEQFNRALLRKGA